MIKGIDISHWNEYKAFTPHIDHIDFCFIKATEGLNYIDNMAYDFAEYMLKKDKLIGFYHFAKFNTPIDSIKEAKHFVKSIRSYVELRNAVLALDVEASALNKSVEYSEIFMSYCYEKLGVKPLIYCSHNEVNRFKELQDNGNKLWVAKWNNSKNITSKILKSEIPKTIYWEKPSIWQYSNMNNSLDCNVFNGTKKQFMKLGK